MGIIAPNTISGENFFISKRSRNGTKRAFPFIRLQDKSYGIKIFIGKSSEIELCKTTSLHSNPLCCSNLAYNKVTLSAPPQDEFMTNNIRFFFIR